VVADAQVAATMGLVAVDRDFVQVVAVLTGPSFDFAVRIIAGKNLKNHFLLRYLVICCFYVHGFVCAVAKIPNEAGVEM